MRIQRRFIWAEHEDLGECGWIPMWVPKSRGFDPIFRASLMAHDMLEHAHTDRGSFREEVIAFGRVIAGRGCTGDVDLGRLGEELYDVWDRTGGMEELEGPLVNLKLDDWGTSVIRDVTADWLEASGRPQDYGQEEALPLPERQRQAVWVAQLLKTGYADAQRRYGGLPGGAAGVGELHVNFGHNAKIPQGEDDDILIATIDLRRHDWDFRVVESWREYHWADRLRCRWHAS